MFQLIFWVIIKSEERGIGIKHIIKEEGVIGRVSRGGREMREEGQIGGYIEDLKRGRKDKTDKFFSENAKEIEKRRKGDRSQGIHDRDLQ